MSLAAVCLVLVAGAVKADPLPQSVKPAAAPRSPFKSVAAQTAAAAAGDTAGSASSPTLAQAKARASKEPRIRPTAGNSLLAQIQSHDMAAYPAHAVTMAGSGELAAQVMAALDHPQPDSSAPTVNGVYASGAAAPAATPSAPVGSDAPAVTGGDAPKAAASILDLNPLNRLGGLATGLSTATRLPAPDEATLGRDTAQAILRAFRAAPGTADQAASDAADTASTGDAALDERIALTRTVFKVDGTDDLIRQFVSTQMMKIVIAEVAKHIDITKLSETDKYRLSAIAAAAQTELEEKVLNLNARVEANYLTKDDLTQLVVAYDTDAQRKQTRLRLSDTGKGDRNAMLDITMAQVQIVKAFESAK